MIHKFTKPRLGFPVKWANEIVDWIGGICSPSGTLKIRNNMSPGESGSALIDVDVEVLAQKIAEKLDRIYVRKDGVQEISDNRSIIYENGILSVNPDFIREIARSV